MKLQSMLTDDKKMKITNAQTRGYFISAIILLIGLVGAILIYLTAENNSNSGFGYEDSKMYMHDLELYGGKVNVLTNKLIRWFSGIWQGQSLAFAVAFITILVSFVVFLVATHMKSSSQSDIRDKNNQTAPGKRI